MQFVNTRPSNRAKPLTLALQQAGYEVLEAPLLMLEALDRSLLLEQQYVDFEQAEYVVVVSPTAAELGLKHYFALGYSEQLLLSKTWIAVGRATQQYLAKYQINSLVPDVETSEGMLNLSIFQQMNAVKIAFWRGIGGRTFMMEQLSQQGCTVINMLLYQRGLPHQSEMLFQQVENNAVILISSEESWNNWCTLAIKYQKQLMQYHYIVLGERVSQVLQQYFYNSKSIRITTIYDLTAFTIIHQLKQSPFL